MSAATPERVHATLLPGLYALELPTPLPVGTVNAYLGVPTPDSAASGDDALTLIDCGAKFEPGYAALSAQLAACGVQLRDVRRLVITHHHVDHLGLAERIVAEAGAAVLAHRLAVPHLETPRAARRRVTDFAEMLFRDHGVPDNVRALLAQADEDFVALVGTARVNGQLAEGDTLMLAGKRWQVLHTPGHAADLLCFYEPDSGILLSSDHLLRDISSNPLIEPPDVPAPLNDPRPRRLLDYMTHEKRLAALRPRLAYTGHGAPILDVPGLVEKRLANHRKRADKTLGLLANGPLTLYQIARRLFPHIGEADSYLILSEALGHLDWLEQDGQVRQQHGADGIVYAAKSDVADSS